MRLSLVLVWLGPKKNINPRPATPLADGRGDSGGLSWTSCDTLPGARGRRRGRSGGALALSAWAVGLPQVRRPLPRPVAPGRRGWPGSGGAGGAEPAVVPLWRRGRVGLGGRRRGRWRADAAGWWVSAPPRVPGPCPGRALRALTVELGRRWAVSGLACCAAGGRGRSGWGALRGAHGLGALPWVSRPRLGRWYSGAGVGRWRWRRSCWAGRVVPLLAARPACSGVGAACVSGDVPAGTSPCLGWRRPGAEGWRGWWAPGRTGRRRATWPLPSGCASGWAQGRPVARWSPRVPRACMGGVRALTGRAGGGQCWAIGCRCRRHGRVSAGAGAARVGVGVAVGASPPSWPA